MNQTRSRHFCDAKHTRAFASAADNLANMRHTNQARSHKRGQQWSKRLIRSMGYAT